MSDFVRVRLPNGAEKSVPVAVAQRYRLKVLDKPAYGLDGRIRPPKPRLPLGRSVSANNSKPEARPASDKPKEG